MNPTDTPMIYLVDRTPNDEDYFATRKRELADALIASGYEECSGEEYDRIRLIVKQRLHEWETRYGI